MAFLRKPCLHLSDGLLHVVRTALPAASLEQFSGAQARHRAPQYQAERWASSAGTSSADSSFSEAISRRSLQCAARGVSWPQLGGMSRRALSAQQVRKLCTPLSASRLLNQPTDLPSYALRALASSPALDGCVPVQNLDKGIASCAEETHGKSFHDAPDKVSFKAQVRCPPAPSTASIIQETGKGWC